MNWAWRSIVPLVFLVALTGCETVSGGSSQSSASPPTVRCLTDPARDNQSTSRPMIFLFCAESP